MRIILKITALPFALACSVLAAAVGLAAGLSNVLLEILGGICMMCALFAWFIQGDGSSGLLMLGIAVFFVALGLLADDIADGLGSLAGSLWGVVLE